MIYENEHHTKNATDAKPDKNEGGYPDLETSQFFRRLRDDPGEFGNPNWTTR